MSIGKVGKKIELRKQAKGARPQFFADPASDKLLAITMALAGEVAVLKTRSDTLERLMEEKGVLSRDEINKFNPSKEVLSERDAWNEEYLGRVLRIMTIDDSEMDTNDTSPRWQELLDQIHQ